MKETVPHPTNVGISVFQKTPHLEGGSGGAGTGGSSGTDLGEGNAGGGGASGTGDTSGGGTGADPVAQALPEACLPVLQLFRDALDGK